jgi:hypothetical protein
VFDASENFSDVGLLSCLARRQLGRQENNFSEVLMGLKRQKNFFCRCIFPTTEKFSVVPKLERKKKKILSFQVWNDRKKNFCRSKLGTTENFSVMYKLQRQKILKNY